MICNTCGRQTKNEDANFCEYCGSSYREHINMTYQPQPSVEVPVSSKENIMTFQYWLGIYGLLLGSVFIPYIGIFIPIVLLCVWAFSNRSNQNKKNWARATLIFLVVYIIVSIVMLVFLMSTPMMQETMSILNNSLLNGL